MRKTVGYLNLSSDGGVRLHLQQATLRVHFRGLSRLTENFAIRLLPRCFYRRDERKTPAPPLSGCRRRLIYGRLRHETYPGTSFSGPTPSRPPCFEASQGKDNRNYRDSRITDLRLS